MNKNLHFALHGVSFAAIAVLFWMQFDAKNNTSKPNKAAQHGAESFVYINSDSLMSRFDWVADRSAQLANREKELQEKLELQVRRLEDRFAELQRKADIMTQDELKAAQFEIQQKEQQINQLRQQLSMQLDTESAQMQQELYQRVEKALQHISSQTGFDAAFSFTRGGQVLYIDSTLDVTQKVLEKLNADYSMDKEKEAKGE